MSGRDGGRGGGRPDGPERRADGAVDGAPIRVLIADDHPLFRTGLAYGLRGEGFDIVAEAEDGRAALSVCRGGGVDVALLDVRMPRMDGIECARAVCALEPAPLVVMLTTFEQPAVVDAARRAGARAYLSKETAAPDLARILRKLWADDDLEYFPKIDLPDLTPREYDVLRLLAAGLTQREMAERLGLRRDTVKDYLGGAYRKLGVHDQVSALRVATELGLV